MEWPQNAARNSQQEVFCTSHGQFEVLENLKIIHVPTKAQPRNPYGASLTLLEEQIQLCCPGSLPEEQELPHEDHICCAAVPEFPGVFMKGFK